MLVIKKLLLVLAAVLASSYRLEYENWELTFGELCRDNLEHGQPPPTWAAASGSYGLADGKAVQDTYSAGYNYCKDGERFESRAQSVAVGFPGGVLIFFLVFNSLTGVYRGVFENIVDVVMALFQILTIFEPQGALALGILSIIFTVLSLAYSIFLALAKRKPDSWQDKLLIKLLKKHPKLIPKIDRSMELPVDWLDPPPSAKEDAESLGEDDTDVEIDSSLEDEKKPYLLTLLSKCQPPQKAKKVQDVEIDSSLEEKKAAELTIEEYGEFLAEVETDVKIDSSLEEEKAAGFISEQSDIPESENSLDRASGSTPDVQISEASHNQVQDVFAAVEQEITAASSWDKEKLDEIFAERMAATPTPVPDPSSASADAEGSMAVADCDITSQSTVPEELLPEEQIPTSTPEGVTMP